MVLVTENSGARVRSAGLQLPRKALSNVMLESRRAAAARLFQANPFMRAPLRHVCHDHPVASRQATEYLNEWSRQFSVSYRNAPGILVARLDYEYKRAAVGRRISRPFKIYCVSNFTNFDEAIYLLADGDSRR